MHELFDPDQVFRIVDIAAVVANGLLGGAVARAFRFDIVGFLLLAVACGMGGGMIRDIMVNRIPAIFGGNSLYATVAFVGAAETALVTGLFHRPNLAMGLSILLCLVLGVLSHMKNWQLPTTPAELRVPRPRLFNFGKQEDRTVANEGWSPGEPLTEQLEVINAEQLEEYRRSKGLSE